MANFDIRASDVPVGRVEFVVQLALIVALCFGAAWLWPDDLLGSSMAAITFPEVLRAVSVPGLLLAAAAWLHLLLRSRLRSRVDEQSGVEPVDKPPHLGTPGYHSH